MSGAHSGRRPELRDGDPEDERNGHRARRGDSRGRDDGNRNGTREEMKDATAKEPASTEEGRCTRCGEEILPVPT